YADTDLAIHFRQPTIHAMVLFVSEQTSIARQLHRGVEIAEQNQKFDETGVGKPQEIRDTDVDPASAAKRYRIFKEQTWDALQSLKEIYHYHFIHAEGDIRDVEANILEELRYQSSLELDPRTYDRVRSIPVAEEITIHARQELVKRLDSYALHHSDLFDAVIGLVEEKMMPEIKRHALTGMARISTEDAVFDDPLASSMLIDVFSERGYTAMIDTQINRIPQRVDPESGNIEYLELSVYRIQIGFEGSSIRRGR
ncbi:MAG: nucleoside monophosphate kinase, partial [Pseudomonadota bacterium]